jgi:hypothetical protein
VGAGSAERKDRRSEAHEERLGSTLESNTYYETVALIEEGTWWRIGKEKRGGYVWPNKVLGINNTTSAMGRKKKQETLLGVYQLSVVKNWTGCSASKTTSKQWIAQNFIMMLRRNS